MNNETTEDQIWFEEDSVIELLKGFPDNVAALAFHGRVTKRDYDQVLIPDFEIASDLEGFDAGAVWEDQKFGWHHFLDWERCAVVTDVSWARHLASLSAFFGFLWPGQYRAFAQADAGEAREWITAYDQADRFDSLVWQLENPDTARMVDTFTE